jgi:hypothetical protein
MIPLNFTKQIKLIRHDSAGTFDKGRYIESSVTETFIRGSVQPLSQTELNNFPEGQRVTGIIKIYTDSNVPLFTALESEGKSADIIEYDNQRYVIVHVDPWHYGILAHYKSFAVKEENNAGDLE